MLYLHMIVGYPERPFLEGEFGFYPLMHLEIKYANDSWINFRKPFLEGGPGISSLMHEPNQNTKIVFMNYIRLDPPLRRYVGSPPKPGPAQIIKTPQILVSVFIRIKMVTERVEQK